MLIPGCFTSPLKRIITGGLHCIQILSNNIDAQKNIYIKKQLLLSIILIV